MPPCLISRKPTHAQTKYSTFDWKLLATYLAIKHCQHFIEGHDFYVCSDHKPLMFALSTHLDKHSPRQAGYLDFISQFTSDVRHLPGHNNAAADTLPHMDVDALEHTSLPPWDFHTLAAAQCEDGSNSSCFHLTGPPTDPALHHRCHSPL